jgi:hypothetical protein
MTELGLGIVKQEGFSLEPEVFGHHVVLRLTGNGDMSVVHALDGYLKLVHTEMQRLGLGETVIDVRELYFMNSSCIKAFVSWIYRVSISDLPYRIRFLANTRQPWQDNTLGALARIAPTVVTIEATEA